MKKYLHLVLILFLSLLVSFPSFAQGKGGNNGGNKYEIIGNQQPCVGSIETYTITPNPGNNAVVWDWDGPRAQANEVAWELMSVSADKSKVTFRVGDKPGTVRAKPDPGSNNTENLPVHPGRGLQVAIDGPGAVCANTDQVYKLAINNLGNGKKGGKNIDISDLNIVWNVNGLTVVSGQNTGTLTVRAAAGFTGGSVSVSVNVPGQSGGPGNSGKGVGPITGFCGANATASLAVGMGANCAPPCPVTTVSIAGPVTVCPAPADFSQEDLVTYTAEVSNGTANMNYSWTLPDGWQIVAGAGSNNIQVKVGLIPGNVQVSVTNNCSGAANASRFVAFGNNCPVPTSECPTPTVKINGPGSVCAGQTSPVKYTATVANTGIAAITYNWLVPAGWEILNGAGTSEIEVKVGSNEGTVALNVATDCGNEVSASRTIAFSTDCGTNPPVCKAPTVSINGPASFCAFQEEPVTFTANVTNNTPDITYEWNVPADWFIESQNGPTIVVYVGFEAGPVVVTVRNACNEATDALETSVDENCVPLEPLPVELLSFTGESTKNGVLLEWSTASEKDNDRFELERSQDGQKFTKVSQVKGKGTSNSRQVYAARDSRAGQGTHYYRLKQVDLDGKFEYSKVIAVKHSFGQALANLAVAPNPVAGGQFTIQLPEATANAQVQIMDMNGRLAATQNLDAGITEATFSTQSLNLQTGIYLVRFKDGSNVSHTKIVVK